MIAEELKKYPEIKMEWSEPGFAFRVTFVKVNYEQEKEKGKTVVATDYDRLRPIADEKTKVENDYERL